ncbi:unnamed protein product [Clonostachys rosea]|uniref:Rhodanese domain-containing protein n=1 Tax=Bionectria ochroleuca TaxID=29856 RepID=A0ABY6U6U7_BIOOC|nr:unnamed protein product [Clonostachys rosea]
MRQTSHSSDKDGWIHFTPLATSQTTPREAIPGHSPNNGFDDASGIHGNSFLFFGAGITHDTNFNSQTQCSQQLSEELNSMPSAPSCPIMLSRNSMNTQFLQCFQFQPTSPSGRCDQDELPASLLDRQGSNPFQTTSAAPVEPPLGSTKIPEILLNSAEDTRSECYYSSPHAYSSGQEGSYPGTPRTSSVNSPLSDAGSFVQIRDERQLSFPLMSTTSTYATSSDGCDDDAASSVFDPGPRACLPEQPNNQYLQPGPLFHSYTYPFERQSRPASNFFDSTLTRRSSDVAPRCSIPTGEAGTDTPQRPHAPSLVTSDRPRSSSDSCLTRPPRSSLKRVRDPDETQRKDKRLNKQSVVRPDMDDGPLEPRRPRGKRRGPLSEIKKTALRRSRTDGNTCLNCCLSKVGCNGEGPCARCAQGFDGRHVPVCTKAHFKDLIKRMSTLSSMPPALRGPIFEPVQFPVSLDEVDISHETLSKIRDISDSWNLQINYGPLRLRIIDLAEMWRSVSTLHKPRFSEIPFPAVFDKHFSRGSRPEKIFLEKGNLPGHLMMYVRWTNVLKFTTVTQISRDGRTSRRIALDGQLYQIVTQIVLIELRRFERNIYEVLSKSLHHQGPKEADPNAVPELVTGLGSLLLSLRWQTCLWKKYQSVLAQDINQVKRELRFAMIQDICRRLYSYYFLCRARCLPESAKVVTGIETHYANMTGSIRENFPTDPYEGGFEAWVRDGDNTVRNCRVDEQSLIHSIL